MMLLTIIFGTVSASTVAVGVPGLTSQNANINNPILGVNQAGSTEATQQFLNNLSNQYGIHWDREDIFWNGGMAWYNQLTEANISIVADLDYHSFQNSSWTIANWKSEVSLALAQYPKIHVWEIWNEPDLPQYQSGYENGSAYNYYMMLKTAYPIIKAFNSSDVVLGLANTIINGGTQQTQQTYQWAQQVWSYGAASYCDAVSLQLYTEMRYLMNYTFSFGLTMSQVVNIALSSYESLTNKPIWITETGMPSNNASTVPSPGNSLQKQAVFVDQMYTFLMSRHYIKAIMWFSTFGSDNPKQYDFGLFNSTSLAPKPALTFLENFVRLENGTVSSTA